MTIHELKTLSGFYLSVSTGAKNFEIRLNDRDYQIGDILILKLWDDTDRCFSAGEVLLRRVTYISEYEQQEGYVVMALSERLDP